MAEIKKIKKVPLRKCVVTNEQYPKMEMFRVVRTQDGMVTLDASGKVRGHGAYVCKKKTAVLASMKKKILDRHLECPVPDTIYNEMLEALEKEGNK